jgi:hypothetical protein
MLIVKMMASTRTPDDQPDSCFTLFSNIRSVQMRQPDPGVHIIELTDERFETSAFRLLGTVYIMNETGKTITSYQPSILSQMSGEVGEKP